MKIQSLVAAVLATLACACTEKQAPQDTSIFTKDQVKTQIDRAADWQLAHMKDFESYVPSLVSRTIEPRGWVQGTFYLGLTTWAQATENEDYLAYLRNHANAQQWELGDRTYHADDHVVAQYYVQLSDIDNKPDYLTPLKSEFEEILTHQPTTSLDFEPRGKISAQGYEHDCQKRWCWSDALFMSPPVWFKLTELTGDPRYADYAHKEYQAVTGTLFDQENGLFFRDTRFLEKKDKNGANIYWSRGNGWVYSGLTNIIDTMDTQDPKRQWYLDLFKTMSESLVELQGDHGYWPSSLHAGEVYTVPETSGTAFFIAGLAWGVGNGTLDAETYMPVIKKGWQALTSAQQDDGMLGYVQQIGFGPDAVEPNHTHLYGAGAYLLAGTQMLALLESGKI